MKSTTSKNFFCFAAERIALQRKIETISVQLSAVNSNMKFFLSHIHFSDAPFAYLAYD